MSDKWNKELIVNDNNVFDTIFMQYSTVIYSCYLVVIIDSNLS